MNIIENSNIVNWDDYPEFICALVMQTNKDIKTDNNLVCPRGEEVVWLVDKSPEIINNELHLNNARVNCLGGLGFRSGVIQAYFDVDVLELHYKPKPKCNTYNELDVGASA